MSRGCRELLLDTDQESVERLWCCQSIDNGIVASLSQMKSGRPISLPQVVDIVGAPSRARTCDLLIRSQTLYPTELRVHGEDGATDLR